MQKQFSPGDKNEPTSGQPKQKDKDEAFSEKLKEKEGQDPILKPSPHDNSGPKDKAGNPVPETTEDHPGTTEDPRPAVTEHKPAKGTFESLKDKLEKGGKLKRKEWDKKDFVSLEEGVIYHNTESGKQPYRMREADSTATDWSAS